VGGLGGANFCFAIAGVKAGEAKERSKTRNEAKRTAGPSSARSGLARDDNVKKEKKKKDKQNEQQVPRRPESGLARDDKLKDNEDGWR
jgi:hypothetical protein